MAPFTGTNTKIAFCGCIVQSQMVLAVVTTYFTKNNSLANGIGFFFRRQGVCQLWSDEHTPLAPRRHRSLPLQRLWTLLQNERTEQTSHQTQKKTGEWLDNNCCIFVDLFSACAMHFNEERPMRNCSQNHGNK